MYQDPTKIRSHVVKLRFSDEEYQLIQAVINYTGEQKAALLRGLVLESAAEIVSPAPRAYESTVQALSRASAGT